MSDERVVSARELNRAMLARQHLLEPAGARTGLPRLLERIGLIQAQYAPSMYIGAWSRLDGFAREDLTRALERRGVVQATLMRSTIHLAAPGDFWPIALAVREARRAWFLRSRRGALTDAEMRDAAARLRERLTADGPLRRADVQDVAGKERTEGVGLWVDLVRLPPSGTWERRRADLFGLAEEWLGPPPDGLSPQDGADLLVRRYLRGFGPAHRAQIADWAGLPVATVAAALDRLALRRMRGPAGEELVDLPRAPLPDAATPAPVRFLPTWDATLLGHARRAAILPDEHRPKIFSTRSPQSTPTFLVDGAVAGTWRHDGGRIDLQPFGRLDATARRALRDEAERLAALHA